MSNQSYSLTHTVPWRVSLCCSRSLWITANIMRRSETDRPGRKQAPTQRNSKHTFIFILIATVSKHLSSGAVIPLTFAFNARLHNMDTHTLLMDQCSLYLSDFFKKKSKTLDSDVIIPRKIKTLFDGGILFDLQSCFCTKDATFFWTLSFPSHGNVRWWWWRNSFL